SSLPSGTVGLAYSQTLTASGGTGSYTFSATGTLPPGLVLATTGVLAGTPTMAGTYTFTITARDSVGDSANQSYTLVISTSTAGSHATLTLPTSGFTGAPGHQVASYPVNIAGLSDGTHVGLVSATLVLVFPTGVFAFPIGGNQATADVNLGSIPLAA